MDEEKMKRCLIFVNKLGKKPQSKNKTEKNSPQPSPEENFLSLVFWCFFFCFHSFSFNTLLRALYSESCCWNISISFST